MKASKKKVGVALAAALLIGALVSASASGAKSRASLTNVRIGIGPYFEYQPWRIAHDLGLDKAEGLNLSFTNLTNTANGVIAAKRGDLDLVSTCHACSFPVFKSAPDFRNWMITNQFKGFIIVGRKGKVLPYAALAKKVGPTAAKKQILKSLKGKTFALNAVFFTPLLSSALAQVGLSIKDVKIVAFADDTKAGLAFIRGVGDYYMGSLPQETKMLFGFPDRFVNVGGAEVLGPGGLWYSLMGSTQGWLSKNHDTALKLMAVWYRTMRYLAEKPSTTLPLFAKYINAQTGSAFTPKQVQFDTTQLDDFMVLARARATAFNPSSPLYWYRSAKFYSDQDKAQLPQPFNIKTYDLEQVYFTDFLKQTQLIAAVNAPLK